MMDKVIHSLVDSSFGTAVLKYLDELLFKLGVESLEIGL